MTEMSQENENLCGLQNHPVVIEHAKEIRRMRVWSMTEERLCRLLAGMIDQWYEQQTRPGCSMTIGQTVD